MILGIDASRIRSGGGIVHLLGLMLAFEDLKHLFKEVHVWSYGSLLERLPDCDWLKKHKPPALEKSLIHQLYWQYSDLPKEFQRHNCDLLFTLDASSLCSVQPQVVLSQDLLSFEKGEMERLPLGFTWFRLWLIKYLQIKALKRANGVIFLSQYARRVLEVFTGTLPNVAIVHHGVDQGFLDIHNDQALDKSRLKQPLCNLKRIVYVSNVDYYKHQWNVVEAVASLRKEGVNLQLTLIGGGFGAPQARLEKVIAKCDPDRTFVEQLPFLEHTKLPALIKKFDLFLFASSCENMPITLIEGMALGMPIVCSDRGPMPEFLEDRGIYFDPEDVFSIAAAVQEILGSARQAGEFARRNAKAALQYTWARTANDTLEFLSKVSSGYKP